MKRSIWDIQDGEYVQIAPPSTEQERATILREKYNAKEAPIIHGGQVRGCVGESIEIGENVMIIPEGTHPSDFEE